MHQQADDHMQAARERLRSRYSTHRPFVDDAPAPTAQAFGAITSTVDAGAMRLETARNRIHSRFTEKFDTSKPQPSHATQDISQDILGKVHSPSIATAWLQMLAQSGNQPCPQVAKSLAHAAL